MAPTTPPVRVVHQIPVSPPPGSVPSSSLPLSFFDLAWLPTGPVERLFFYYSSPHPTSHFLPSLQSSLSLALRRFYLLAGCVRPNPSADGRFEYSYSDGDSVTLTVAECAADFDEFTSSSPRDISKLCPLVPQLPRSDDGSIQLSALQVTFFPDHGLCIGISIHHVACDDSTSIHFVKSWAAACRLGDLESPDAPSPPVFDRSLIADPDGLYSKTVSEMNQFAANGPPPPPDPAAVGVEKVAPVIASFSLGREQIDRVKQLVSAKAAEEGGAAVHCSAFVVACALCWVCLLKAQGPARTGKSRAHFLFSAECRARLTPPIPAEYFGNCLRPCFVEADVSDLLRDDGILAAAVAIGRAIKGMEAGLLEGAEGWFKKIISLLPEGPMSVGGSPKYRVYDTDFGWGRPAKVEMVSIEKTPGTVSLAESREEQGGIEIGVVLPQAEMEDFCSCFSGGLQFI